MSDKEYPGLRDDLTVGETFSILDKMGEHRIRLELDALEAAAIVFALLYCYAPPELQKRTGIELDRLAAMKVAVGADRLIGLLGQLSRMGNAVIADIGIGLKGESEDG